MAPAELNSRKKKKLNLLFQSKALISLNFSLKVRLSGKFKRLLIILSLAVVVVKFNQSQSKACEQPRWVSGFPT